MDVSSKGLFSQFNRGADQRYFAGDNLAATVGAYHSSEVRPRSLK
jgi:hypothetical protein